MLQLKTVLKRVESFDFLFSKLALQSGLAKRYLLDSPFMTDAETIEKSLSEVEQMQQLLEQPIHSDCFAKIQRKLMNVRDVNATFSNLERGLVLDDIDLFEIKNFCLTVQSIAALFSKTASDVLYFPALDSVLDILDPDGVRMSNFYIYDSYSSALENIRTEIKRITQTMAALPEDDVAQHRKLQKSRDDFYQQSVVIEDDIRKEIASRLFRYMETLQCSLDNVAHLDILMAKAQQAIKLRFTKPFISCESTTFRRLFNPHIQHLLEQNGKRYQAIDLHIPQQPCLITGANMVGKTVLLKTLCLAQYLFQFGFFVPAESAQMCIVDAVLTCMEDEQSDLKGLSSFAAEILNVNNMLRETANGRKPLILIDELAQTTNPVEGSAIVNSVLEFLYENKVQSVITTHFANITAPCKKLRVKGFIEKSMSEPVTYQNINDFIDYSLVEDTIERVPMEALRIAKILGVGGTLVERAEQYLQHLHRHRQ